MTLVPETEVHKFCWLERFGAAVVAAVAGVGVLELLTNAPHLKQAASSCASASCVVTVSSTDQTAAVALIALAAAAALIAVLGFRFTKISAAGASLEGGASVGEADPKKVAEKDGWRAPIRLVQCCGHHSYTH